MTYTPKRGDLVRDRHHGWVGRVLGPTGEYVHVRALGGGLEWGAKPEHLSPADQSEAMSSAVTVANARSRGEAV
ncbi:hypothetical protein [Streptomyces sp. PR69]|uniref:hypothetical protein n=1 Tax=Streptomyces sp. PR69 TaxID=2984950 RepID=UPI0022642392|nr:hypothetical protein [Streptomyces sp. PR69]